MSSLNNLNNFKIFYSEFLKTINEKELYSFRELKNDEDRIKHVYRFPFINSKKIATAKNIKSAENAKTFKESGNKAFQVNQFEVALDFYSKAIIEQPQNSSSEVEDLSVLFANRSAALYHLKDYKVTLDNIQNAIDHNYPASLQYKILDRKARCFLALNQLKSAKEAFRQTIQALDNSNLSSERRQKWQRDVQIMLAMLDKNRDVKNAPSKITTDIDKFKDGINKDYPVASSAVAFKEDSDMGRFAEAISEIKPGDLLLQEKPYCSVLLEKFSSTHCFNCFMRVSAPYPCPSCSNVVFCSKSCQEAALQSHHTVECAILTTLWTSGASVTCMMAIRIISQKTLDYFLKLKPNLTEPSKEKVYKSNDYKKVYELVNHSSTRSTEDFLHRTVMAIFLLRCLQATSYFDKNNESSPKITESELTENEQFIGGLILRHLQSLQFNSHEVAELVIKGENKQSVFIGAAVYPTLALFNHSCNPGIVRYHKGTKVVVRAIRTIKSGEMIAENYGPIFTQVQRNERKETLKAQYWFDCQCVACLEDWPTISSMNNADMRFRCDCSNIIIIPVDTTEFMVPCQNCKQHINILKGLKALQDTDMTFRVAKSLEREGKYGAALQKFLDLLSLLDTTLAPPFRDYHLCQQEIRTCMLTFGNVYVEKST